MGLFVAPDLASPERRGQVTAASSVRTLRGMPAAVLLFSYYPADPRPRRAAEALAGEACSSTSYACAEMASVHVKRSTGFPSYGFR
jgi:hypothetical protein